MDIFGECLLTGKFSLTFDLLLWVVSVNSILELILDSERPLSTISFADIFAGDPIPVTIQLCSTAFFKVVHCFRTGFHAFAVGILAFA